MKTAQEKVKISIAPGGRMPTKKQGDAAFDLYAAEECVLMLGETRAISVGISLELPGHLYARIAGRSGLASKGIGVLGGVIDPSYRGPIKAILCNHSSDALTINRGDRIAQMIIERFEDVEFVQADELTATERGEKGFGSSGV